MLDTSVSKTPRTKSSLARAPDLQDLVSMMTESMPFIVTGDGSSRQEEEQRKQQQHHQHHQQKPGVRSELTTDYDLDDKENVGGNGESGSLRKKGMQQMLPKVGSDSGSSSQDQGKSTVAGVERSPLSDKTPFVAVKSKKEQREDISNRGAAANLAEHAKIESEVSREMQLAGVDSAKSGGSGRDSIGRSASLSVCAENHTQRPPAARASSREGRSREQRKVEGREKEKEKEKEVGSRSRSRSRSTARGEARGRMMDRHAELEGRIQRLASSCERERESGMGGAPVHAPSPNHTGAVITLGQPGQALLQHQHQQHQQHQQQHRKEQEKKSERRQESLTEAGQPLPQSRDEAADAAQIKHAPQAAAAAAPQQPTITTTSTSTTASATTPALVTTITTKVGTQTDAVSLEKLPCYSSSATQTPPDQELARAKGDAERLEATVADLVETYTMVSERKKATVARRASARVRAIRLRCVIRAWAEASAKICECDALRWCVRKAEERVEGLEREIEEGRGAGAMRIVALCASAGIARAAYFSGLSRRGVMRLFEDIFDAWRGAVDARREQAASEEARRERDTLSSEAVVRERDAALAAAEEARRDRDAISASLEAAEASLIQARGEVDALKEVSAGLVAETARRAREADEAIQREKEMVECFQEQMSADREMVSSMNLEVLEAQVLRTVSTCEALAQAMSLQQEAGGMARASVLEREVVRLKREKEEEILRLNAENEREVMRLEKEREEEMTRLEATKEEEIVSLKKAHSDALGEAKVEQVNSEKLVYLLNERDRVISDLQAQAADRQASSVPRVSSLRKFGADNLCSRVHRGLVLRAFLHWLCIAGHGGSRAARKEIRRLRSDLEVQQQEAIRLAELVAGLQKEKEEDEGKWQIAKAGYAAMEDEVMSLRLEVSSVTRGDDKEDEGGLDGGDSISEVPSAVSSTGDIMSVGSAGASLDELTESSGEEDGSADDRGIVENGEREGRGERKGEGEGGEKGGRREEGGGGVWVKGGGGVDWDLVQKWVCDDEEETPCDGDASFEEALAGRGGNQGYAEGIEGASSPPQRAILAGLTNPFGAATPHFTPYHQSSRGARAGHIRAPASPFSGQNHATASHSRIDASPMRGGRKATLDAQSAAGGRGLVGCFGDIFGTPPASPAVNHGMYGGVGGASPSTRRRLGDAFSSPAVNRHGAAVVGWGHPSSDNIENEVGGYFTGQGVEFRGQGPVFHPGRAPSVGMTVSLDDSRWYPHSGDSGASSPSTGASSFSPGQASADKSWGMGGWT